MIKESPCVSSETLHLAYREYAPMQIRKDFYRTYTQPNYDIETEVDLLLNIQENDRILDIGCGTGRLLQTLKTIHPNASYTGIDISEGIFRIAHQREQQVPGISYCQADGQKLPFRDESQDKVSLMHMLYHVPNQEQTVSESARILRKTGVAIFTGDSIHSKPKLKSMKEHIASFFGFPSYPYTAGKFNIESGEQLVKKYFSSVKTVRYESNIVLTDATPYVQYFHSTRSFWTPYPNDSLWRDILEYVNETVQNEINRNGVYTERNAFGIIVARKI